ncbi:bromodomain-containing protein 8-like isoform X1 [Acanthaster planci]|uniref:Bromodomain-containing protein 8-like isoform X1 n=1 Tax=Acanthaster planci TaxID=133434 RepID=A0A8B7ZMQ4_ACAPL|nr:bromodomain-containing protein 8-like isoform X1 [Acanthaster planci]
MAGLNVAPADQWSLCEKLCLASSVIRSGDQNWVSVSRAIKPFGEPGRPPDFFSQKNCALQYSALLETVETPKRKRSERGEVVETPGDLIVRKVTKERIAELKVQLEEDKARYRQLKLEIEEIRSGGADDRLQSMWEEVQEEKRAAKEAEETQKAAAEAAKAAAVVKPTSKPNFQSPSKRRPQVRNPRVGTRTQSETSSVGDSVEVEDSVLASPVKLTEESGSGPEDIATKQSENSATDFLTSIVANELQKETETATNQEEEVAAEEDSEETAERLLAATASDLVELLSPYPVDSPSSQSVDESSLPASEHGTPVPRVKEPLILKIEKGMVKTRESKVETKVPETEESHETEMINVDEPVSDRQPTSLQAGAGNPVIGNSAPRGSVESPQASGQQGGTCSESGQPSDVFQTNNQTELSSASSTYPATPTQGIAHDEPCTAPQPPKQATPKSKFRSPTRKSLSPEEQRAITQKLDAALYNPQEGGDAGDPSPLRWLRSVQDRKKSKLEAPLKCQEQVAQSKEERETSTNQMVDEAKKFLPKEEGAVVLETKKRSNKKQKTEELVRSFRNVGPPKVDLTPNGKKAKAESITTPKAADSDPSRTESIVTPSRKKSPRKATSNTKSAAEQADKSADVTPVTKPRAEPGEDDYHHIEPPSPGDSSSREDSDMKSKRRGARGRPLGSQRKSSRIRTHTTTEEEDDRALDTPSGRRSSGKDGTASSIVSLMDEDSKDTHSEAGDSDVTDKPSESDDLSASTGALQSSYFLDSLPNSPASVAQSEEDHAYKTWRKAIMLVWRAVASHKYANVFLHPVTEDIAPGYKSIVMRPMDLITIKKNIENGMIRTTEQFHRDMMLMFQNAIMYNNADQHVHQIATVMQADVVKQIEEFVSTQLLVQQPDSTKMLRGRGKQGQGEEERSRRSSTEADTSGKKRRTRADEN